MDLPDHINPDDDQAVEKYLAKQAKAAALKEAAASAKASAGMNDDAKLTAAANAVQKMLGEIAAGL